MYSIRAIQHEMQTGNDPVTSHTSVPTTRRCIDTAFRLVEFVYESDQQSEYAVTVLWMIYMALQHAI